MPDISNTALVLTRVMNMAELRSYPSPDGVGEVHVFSMGEGGPAAELHVAVQPDLPAARQGAGAVHHVAFRAPDVETLHRWTERLGEFRLPSSGEVERFYFRSLYFASRTASFRDRHDGARLCVTNDGNPLAKAYRCRVLEPKRAQIEARLKASGSNGCRLPRGRDMKSRKRFRLSFCREPASFLTDAGFARHRQRKEFVVMTKLLAYRAVLPKASFKPACSRRAQAVGQTGWNSRPATLHGIPLYDGDVEAKSGRSGRCGSAEAEDRRADGRHFLHAGINNSVPGVFKNAIDW